MEENTIDLKKYWLLLKHWAWLLILALVLGFPLGHPKQRCDPGDQWQQPQSQP